MGRAADAVVQKAADAGVWVSAAGWNILPDPGQDAMLRQAMVTRQLAAVTGSRRSALSMATPTFDT